VAKKTIRRTRYPLEDNVKRALFLRPTETTIVTPAEFDIPYASREETDAGVLLDKVLNPDVGAYAYDRFRHAGLHSAGKATRAILIEQDGSIEIDCRRSNVFRLLVTGAATIANPIYPLDGQVVNILIKQDGTGGHAVSRGNKILVAGSIATGANARSLLSMQYDAADGVWVGVISSGFA
jgi:hypothetical protein